jgi:hypothetical protein
VAWVSETFLVIIDNISSTLVTKLLVNERPSNALCNIDTGVSVNDRIKLGGVSGTYRKCSENELESGRILRNFVGKCGHLDHYRMNEWHQQSRVCAVTMGGWKRPKVTDSLIWGNASTFGWWPAH